MKVITVLGAVDKRVITYPLIKALGLDGKVLVISDDNVFRRFDSELSTEFTYDTVEFLITQDILGVDEARLTGYETILIISTSEIHPKTTKLVYVHMETNHLYQEKVLEELEGKDFVNVMYVTGKKVTEEADIKFTPNKGLYDYVNQCESAMEFLPVKEGNMGLTLKKMFDDHLEVDSKTLSSILKRG